MFTFFFSETSPFSQWHPSMFLISGARARASHGNQIDQGFMFCCAEQWMMYGKAMLFGDHTTAMQILLANQPRDHKALGRKVNGFKEAVWTEHRQAIVREGNYAKFTQNPELLAQLLATNGTTLVEANPYDKVWGIGLPASDPRAQDPKQWPGQNLLGKILTDLRNELFHLCQ